MKIHHGEKNDGSDSFASQLGDHNHWPELTMIVTVLSLKEKKVSSRAGMKQTVKTSPLYPMWLNTIDEDLKTVEQALIDKNFNKLGSTMEMNAIKMHYNDIAQLLIKSGADINLGASYNTNPLSTAVSYNNEEMKNILVKLGAKSNIK